MTAHLHLRHPHLPLVDRFMACVHEGIIDGAFDHLRHRKPPVAYTDPAVIAEWAQWQTPDEWAHKHMGGER